MQLQIHRLALADCQLNDKTCEAIRGGGHQRHVTAKPSRSKGTPGARISAGFYQINIAMNFIVGGSGNSITTMQGNDIGSLSFRAIAPAST